MTKPAAAVPNKGGRPAVGPLVSGLRLPEAMLTQIDALAEASGATRSATIRSLLAQALR